AQRRPIAVPRHPIRSRVGDEYRLHGEDRASLSPVLSSSRTWLPQVRSGPDGVCLAEPSGELLIELVRRADAEVMHEQTPGVGADRCDSGIANLALKVEVPSQSPIGPVWRRRTHVACPS